MKRITKEPDLNWHEVVQNEYGSCFLASIMSGVILQHPEIVYQTRYLLQRTRRKETRELLDLTEIFPDLSQDIISCDSMGLLIK